jgi:hypothetical protein
MAWCNLSTRTVQPAQPLAEPGLNLAETCGGSNVVLASTSASANRGALALLSATFPRRYAPTLQDRFRFQGASSCESLLNTLASSETSRQAAAIKTERPTTPSWPVPS